MLGDIDGIGKIACVVGLFVLGRSVGTTVGDDVVVGLNELGANDGCFDGFMVGKIVTKLNIEIVGTRVGGMLVNFVGELEKIAHVNGIIVGDEIVVNDGINVGLTVGVEVGLTVGPAVGLTVGVTVGPTVGLTVGVTVGPTVGLTVGVTVGPTVGLTVGVTVGPTVCLTVGVTVGPTVCLKVGLTVGRNVFVITEVVGGLTIGRRLGTLIFLIMGAFVTTLS